MSNLNILTREEVGAPTQKIFDSISSKMGMLPNLYAAVSNSPKALAGLLALKGNLGDGEFSNKEVEIIALTIGESNSCSYCISAHTTVAKSHGISEEETLRIRSGKIDDPKISALVMLTKSLVISRGKPSKVLVKKFFNAGYNQAALAELIGHVALNTFSNYINHIADTPIDFPLAANI